MKKMLLIATAIMLVFGAGLMLGQNKVGKPKSILHIVTVKWKPDSTPAQREAAIKGVEKMASQIPGMKNVWLDTLKVQGNGYNNVIVMEFENEAAFKAYASHAAHTEWEKGYLAIRGESTTHDATNK
jgi:hypothetical protein